MLLPLFFSLSSIALLLLHRQYHLLSDGISLPSILGQQTDILDFEFNRFPILHVLVHHALYSILWKLAQSKMGSKLFSSSSIILHQLGKDELQPGVEIVEEGRVGRVLYKVSFGKEEQSQI